MFKYFFGGLVMRIDHIGYAVKDIEKAKKNMESLGYKFDPTINDPNRNIYISFGELDGYRIELVSPSGINSPVDTFLSKIGPTPYHICYKSRNIEADIELLKKSRFRVSIPLSPAVAFGGKRVIFMYSLFAGLIEIVEE